jgi:hypothetical protein
LTKERETNESLRKQLAEVQSTLHGLEIREVGRENELLRIRLKEALD